MVTISRHNTFLYCKKHYLLCKKRGLNFRIYSQFGSIGAIQEAITGIEYMEFEVQLRKFVTPK